MISSKEMLSKTAVGRPVIPYRKLLDVIFYAIRPICCGYLSRECGRNSLPVTASSRKGIN
jgi:hypothetical protein